MTDTIVTAANAPLLHACLETISHDRGSGAGHDSYAIPAQWLSAPDIHEAAIGYIDEDDLEDFCIGDVDDMEKMCREDPRLLPLHQFLSHFYDNFEDQT